MHLVIISGAARPQHASNTAKIIEAFRKGFEQDGNSSEVWYLSDRTQWEGAAGAFRRERKVLFALPLYVENIPGIMLEFLEQFEPENNSGKEIAFLLQGGFPEACQSRCCEKYLETLPEQLGCEYKGTLIKGDMFGLSMSDEKTRRKMLEPFEEMGRYFAKNGYFDKETVSEFAAPERMPGWQVLMFNMFFHRIQKIFMGKIAGKMGCTEKLDARPYEK